MRQFFLVLLVASAAVVKWAASLFQLPKKYSFNVSGEVRGDDGTLVANAFVLVEVFADYATLGGKVGRRVASSILRTDADGRYSGIVEGRRRPSPSFLSSFMGFSYTLGFFAMDYEPASRRLPSSSVTMRYVGPLGNGRFGWPGFPPESMPREWPTWTINTMKAPLWDPTVTCDLKIGRRSADARRATPAAIVAAFSERIDAWMLVHEGPESPDGPSLEVGPLIEHHPRGSAGMILHVPFTTVQVPAPRGTYLYAFRTERTSDDRKEIIPLGGISFTCAPSAPGSWLHSVRIERAKWEAHKPAIARGLTATTNGPRCFIKDSG